MSTVLEPQSKNISQLAANKNTKIVATVGPACSDLDKLLELAEAGVNVFRLNFSHGDHDMHLKVIQNIVDINNKYDLHLSILADLQGPKIRIGVIENNGIDLKKDDIVTFVNEDCIGTKEKIYMSYKDFPKDVQVGEKILLDDGKLTFEVISTDRIGTVKMKVIYGGILSSKKGVNLPDTKTSLPCLTEKDLIDLDFILTQPVNWIALSFVRRAEDVIDLKKCSLRMDCSVETISSRLNPNSEALITAVVVTLSLATSLNVSLKTARSYVGFRFSTMSNNAP